MFAVGIALLATVSMPKTFEELEIAKIEAVHGIKSFHMVMKADGTMEGGPLSIQVDLIRDGRRTHAKIGAISDKNGTSAEIVDNGSTSRAIYDPQKIYTEVKDDPKAIFDPKDLLLQPPPHQFYYQFNSAAQFAFASDPPFSLKPIETVQEGGLTLRRAIGVTKNPKSGNTLTVTQWFLPDRWILKRFTVVGMSDKGPFKVTGVATTLDFKTTIGANDFALDTAMIKGYRRQDDFATYFHSAEAGDSKAMWSVANAYYMGQGVSVNYEEAAKWAKKGAEAGNTDAMHGLANLYETGKGVKTDLAEALKWERKAAEAGNVDAMGSMAYIYSHGEGVAPDYAEAAKWTRKAAEAGNTDAMLGMGDLYLGGKGVATDFAEAFKWHRKAAEAGNTDAMDRIAHMYATGQGVGQDDKEAAKWYKKAADADNVYGMEGLAYLYFTGRGVVLDYAEAVKWYRKAADAGNANAMYGLGYCYEMGEGVDMSKILAISWYMKADKAGYPDAKDALKRLGYPE